MNCAQIQNRLLIMPTRAELPAELSNHLRTCPNCQNWQATVGKLDTGLTNLPVPEPFHGPQRVLAQFQSELPLPFAQAPRPKSKPIGSQLRVIGSIAAAVLIAVGLGVIATWPTSTPTPIQVARPTDQLLAKLTSRHAQLMTARGPDERVNTLRDLAGDLRDQSKAFVHVAGPDEMNDLAEWYDQIVRRGLMTQATALADQPASRREALLGPVADELGKTADQLDVVADTAPPGSVRHLRRIASTAREGEQYVRTVIRRGV